MSSKASWQFAFLNLFSLFLFRRKIFILTPSQFALDFNLEYMWVATCAGATVASNSKCTEFTEFRPRNQIQADNLGFRLGRVDFQMVLPPCWTPSLPILPNFHLPKQNLADGGASKTKSTKSSHKLKLSPCETGVRAVVFCYCTD